MAELTGLSLVALADAIRARRVSSREATEAALAWRDLFAYIEGYYNRRRLHSAIGYITPEQADRKTA